MASKRGVAAAVLILRLLALILLAASLAIVAAAKIRIPGDALDPPETVTFRDAYAYRYVLAVAVIACVYTLLQIPVAAVSMARRRRVVGGSVDVAMFLVSADVVFSLLMATGAGAGFGLTVDSKHYIDRFYDSIILKTPDIAKIQSDYDKFFDLVNVSSGLILAATMCMAIMIVISVYSLT